jgi:hypothetical protein
MERDMIKKSVDRKKLWFAMMAFVAALALQPQTATAQQVSRPSDSGFSFAVYGDSRPMMYLPYKEGQPDLNKLFVEMFGLVLPEKVAEEVVKRDVKTIFDPVTKELIKVIMPFESKTEVMTLTGQGLGDRGFCRGCEIASRRAPHDVPTSGRRMGGA